MNMKWGKAGDGTKKERLNQKFERNRWNTKKTKTISGATEQGTECRFKKNKARGGEPPTCCTVLKFPTWKDAKNGQDYRTSQKKRKLKGEVGILKKIGGNARRVSQGV